MEKRNGKNKYFLRKSDCFDNKLFYGYLKLLGYPLGWGRKGVNESKDGGEIYKNK